MGPLVNFPQTRQGAMRVELSGVETLVPLAYFLLDQPLGARAQLCLNEGGFGEPLAKARRTSGQKPVSPHLVDRPRRRSQLDTAQRSLISQH